MACVDSVKAGRRCCDAAGTPPCALQDQGTLEGAVLQALAALGLQAPGPLVAKALQLSSTLDVRFGVMLVGGRERGAAARP